METILKGGNKSEVFMKKNSLKTCSLKIVLFEINIFLSLLKYFHSFLRRIKFKISGFNQRIVEVNEKMYRLGLLLSNLNKLFLVRSF